MIKNFIPTINISSIIKKNQDKNKYFHLIGGGVTCWIIWQSSTALGIILGESIPEKLGLSFAVPLTFLALLVNDFRKIINVIVAALAGLFTAAILTRKNKKA